MRSIVSFVALLGAMSAPALSAHAQTSGGTVLQVHAHFAYPGSAALHNVTGTLTVDQSTGKVNNVNLSYDGLPPAFVGDGGSTQYGSAESPVTGITESWNAGIGRDGYSAVALVIPVASLAGYTGGQICSKANPCSGMPMSSVIRHENFYLVDGEITTGTASSPSAASGM